MSIIVGGELLSDVGDLFLVKLFDVSV